MGHRESEIGGYEVDKFRTYVTAAGRLEAGRRVSVIMDTSTAISGALSGSKAIQAYVDALKEAAD